MHEPTWQPREPDPMPPSFPEDEQTGGFLQTLDEMQDEHRPAWLAYLCVRRWMAMGVPHLVWNDRTPVEARDAARQWAINLPRKMDSRTPLGAVIDDPDSQALFAPFRPETEPELLDGALTAMRLTLEALGVRETLAFEDWPTVAQLDDMEMLAIEWVAQRTEDHRTMFQMVQDLVTHTPMARRQAASLINTWRAVMGVAMTRSKQDARAEAELQLLRAAQSPEASPSVKAGSTKVIAGLHGLGKEDRSVSLEGQIMSLLIDANAAALPEGDESDLKEPPGAG